MLATVPRQSSWNRRAHGAQMWPMSLALPQGWSRSLHLAEAVNGSLLSGLSSLRDSLSMSDQGRPFVIRRDLSEKNFASYLARSRGWSTRAGIWSRRSAGRPKSTSRDLSGSHGFFLESGQKDRSLLSSTTQSLGTVDGCHG